MRKNNYLFFYGTLRKSFNHSVLKKVEDKLDFIGQGLIKGKMLDVGQYPGFVETSTDSKLIKGEVYSIIDEQEKVLNFLDKYEGYEKNNLDKSEYIRKRKNVILFKQGKIIRSWIYVYMNPKHKTLKEIKSGDYIQFLKQKTN